MLCVDRVGWGVYRSATTLCLPLLPLYLFFSFIAKNKLSNPEVP